MYASLCPLVEKVVIAWNQGEIYTVLIYRRDVPGTLSP
jgi:hypothetical protein